MRAVDEAPEELAGEEPGRARVEELDPGRPVEADHARPHVALGEAERRLEAGEVALDVDAVVERRGLERRAELVGHLEAEDGVGVGALEPVRGGAEDVV